MTVEDIKKIVLSGENTHVEFKLDDIRPEQLARVAAGMANMGGGRILLGVADSGQIQGISRKNMEEWVMDTVFSHFIHPTLIPNYEEVLLPAGVKIAVLSVPAGPAKPYVVRQNGREDMFVRIGSTTRIATREQVLRLFSSSGLLHAESLPVAGTTPSHLDFARIDNYFRDFLSDRMVPAAKDAWTERLLGLGFLATDSLGRIVCSIAGLALFGIHPRRHLPQCGLRVMVFDNVDKQYQARLDVVLDGPMVGRFAIEDGQAKALIDDGLVEKFVRVIEPFVTVESETISHGLRREKQWNYPLEAIREMVLNAMVHRDWTRTSEIEIIRFTDRLEVVSPGSLPNSMTIEKMKAGRRTPRNPICLEVMRDYGYVDARGMGVRTKIIPLTRQCSGRDAEFENADDFLGTVIYSRASQESVPESDVPKSGVPESVPESDVPESDVPESDVPESDVPESDVPESDVPESVPESDVPESVPESDVPESDVPESDVPESDVPKSGVPESDVPESDVPESDVPESDVPESDVPESDVPESTSDSPLADLILKLIQEEPRIKYEQLVMATGENRKTVQRALQALKVRGLLRRIGSARNGFWEIPR